MCTNCVSCSLIISGYNNKQTSNGYIIILILYKNINFKLYEIFIIFRNSSVLFCKDFKIMAIKFCWITLIFIY